MYFNYADLGIYYLNPNNPNRDEVSQAEIDEFLRIAEDLHWVSDIYTGNDSDINNSDFCASNVIADGPFNCPGTFQYVFLKFSHFTSTRHYG